LWGVFLPLTFPCISKRPTDILLGNLIVFQLRGAELFWNYFQQIVRDERDAGNFTFVSRAMSRQDRDSETIYHPAVFTGVKLI
jgi:hypothetical protein